MAGFKNFSFYHGESQSQDYRTTKLHDVIMTGSLGFQTEISVLKDVMYAVASGVDLDAANRYGTALHMAVENMYLSVMSYLLSQGANPRVLDGIETYQLIMDRRQRDRLLTNHLSSLIPINDFFGGPQWTEQQLVLKVLSLLKKYNVDLHLTDPLPSGRFPIETAIHEGFEKVAL